MNVFIRVSHVLSFVVYGFIVFNYPAVGVDRWRRRLLVRKSPFRRFCGVRCYDGGGNRFLQCSQLYGSWPVPTVGKAKKSRRQIE
jgi:hypothetical protein